MTEVKLELLNDSDMLHMIKSGIRSGTATISHRYANANNKYMWQEFHPAMESKFISYLDANGLYVWAMSKHLPTDRFNWMTDKELDN